MTGGPIARARWRALDREGEDYCSLAAHSAGFMLVGHARFRDRLGAAALDYVVRCDANWHTTSADVTGLHGSHEIKLHLARDGDDWELNGVAQPQVAGARDVDFGFSPATNLMPLRRLPQVGALPVRAAWLTLPGPRLDPLDQTYTRERGGYVRYQCPGTGFEAHLRVSACGFVSDYPDHWEAMDA
ncbi:putative glycolipid-binding domain-containing protein [Thalassococcus sp. CAU 1522]|uniref:Glycolipid-binding domain-containing protein n=1 Tax=Thalassococcus arenae TaxID=2851652 RepID=A0ABS6N5F4_9RHOB|nr:putative glycolipid-binding domain-containing protein [Thalassococcus arenae]MBV2359242.1 putative glycolipid-binding domain-containing protein [Thalassococcus arenae]